jgi:hypothetical protein
MGLATPSASTPSSTSPVIGRAQRLPGRVDPNPTAAQTQHPASVESRISFHLPFGGRPRFCSPAMTEGRKWRLPTVCRSLYRMLWANPASHAPCRPSSDERSPTRSIIHVKGGSRNRNACWVADMTCASPLPVSSIDTEQDTIQRTPRYQRAVCRPKAVPYVTRQIQSGGTALSSRRTNNLQ